MAKSVMKKGDMVSHTPFGSNQTIYGIIIERYHDGSSYMDSTTRRPFMRNKVLFSSLPAGMVSKNSYICEMPDSMLEVISEAG